MEAAAEAAGDAGADAATEGREAEQSSGDEDAGTDAEREEEMRITVSVNGADFSATLEENEAAAALVEMLREGPLVLSLSDYGGFEKVGALGAELPASDERITTGPGDIVLYQGDQIVAFYGSNTWAYTPLAHVDDLEGWKGALGDGRVEVTLSLEEE